MILPFLAGLAFAASVATPTPAPTVTPSPVKADAEDLSEYVPRFLYATQKVGDSKIEYEAWIDYKNKVRRRTMEKHRWKVGDVWVYDPSDKSYHFEGTEYAESVSGTAH